MLETDAGSRNRLIGIIVFLALMFGGFALWGVVSRAVERGAFPGGGAIGEPASVSPSRAVRLAERREWYTVRKRMAERGKRGDYAGAVQIADAYLAKSDFGNIHDLRSEALYRLGDRRGAAELQTQLKGDLTLPPHERDLLIGDIGAYGAATTEALRRSDIAGIEPGDANNLAWRAALVPGATDAAGVQTAVLLAEGAVAAARKSGNANDIATFTNTLGAVYYRAGRNADAVRLLTESERLQEEPFNTPFFALSYHGLGDDNAAKKWQQRLAHYLDNTYATRDGQTARHQLLLLWHETNAVLGQESDKIRVK